MNFKLILKACALTTLLTCSLSAFSAEQVKCPSVELVKAKLPGLLNSVTKICDNRFEVSYDDLMRDDETGRDWRTYVFVVDTGNDDFTEAYKTAKNVVAGIASADRSTTDGVCLYLNKNGEESGVELYLYRTNQQMKKMHVRK